MRIVFVLPQIFSYRVNVIRRLSKNNDVYVIADKQLKTPVGTSFKVGSTRKFANRLYWQGSTLSEFVKGDFDIFFIQGHVRYLDYWCLLLINSVLRRRLIVHSQGPYKSLIRNDYKASLILRFIFWIQVKLCYKFVLYNNYCLDCFKLLNLNLNKVRVAENNLYFDGKVLAIAENRFVERIKDIGPHNLIKVFFLGRLRDKNGLDEFLSFLGSSISKHRFELHIIGGGDQLQGLRERYSSVGFKVIFYGAVFDPEDIAGIAGRCHFGLYPGSAGLSLLHYSSLSLIPVFRKLPFIHEGPEFAYFTDQLDSVQFDCIDENLPKRLLSIMNSQRLYFEMATASKLVYEKLATRGIAENLEDIFDET